MAAYEDASGRGPRGGGGRRGALRAWAAWWVLCAALWLALVDRLALDELLAGVGAPGGGGPPAWLAPQRRRTLVPPPARWLVSAGKPLLAFVGDLGPLAQALV